MKKCASCGADNQDDAARCPECGSAGFVAASPSSVTSTPWAKIVALAHEVEAERLDLELGNRGIPHLLRSYHDSALDGLYQTAHGWGHIEAPSEYKENILAVLQDIRQSCSEVKEDPDDNSNSNSTDRS
jgi:hypothetical protein